MDLYAENILDHFRNPHHKQVLTDATITHEEINHSCGDAVVIQLKMKNGVLEDVGWTGTGCAISQAGMSILSDELIGKNEKDLAAISQKDIVTLLGVPVGPRRFKCAFLSLHVLKNALRKWHGQLPESWLETVGEAK